MFEELRVLELASVLAGPAVGQFFAELGASVIKVENTRTLGDVTRSWKSPNEETDDRSAYFSAVNWGKRSIGLDLQTPEGKSILGDLARRSDLVIASYKPGDAAKLGVDYASLSRLNPQLIYGQITGYGSDDPRVGYDAVIQAEAGFMYINGEPGRSSTKMPVALIDILAAHQLKEGILLAMLKKTKSGEGGFIEVSLIQAAIASLANQATNWLVGGMIPQKQGSAHPNIAPYGDVFLTATGDEILLAIGTDRQFALLCEVLDVDGPAQDPKFSTNAARVSNRLLLHFMLQGPIRRHRTAELMVKLQECQVPAGVIRNLKHVLELDHAKEIFLESADRVGLRTYIGKPLYQISSHFTPPPHLGQHTIEILTKDLNFELGDVQGLISRRIIS